MKKLSEKSVGMSGLLLTNVFALSGGPRHHKNPFARGIPPRPLLAIRPARRPIDRCDQQPAGPFTSCLSFVFPVPFQRVRSAFCAPQPGSADPPDQLRRAPVCLSGRRGWPTRPSSSPAHRQPPVPQPHAAPCSHDGAPTLWQAVPSSFTRTSSSSCWSGLPPRRPIRSWLTFCPDRIGAVCHAGPGNCHPALLDMSPETLSLAGLSRRPRVRPMP